jgi:membrane protease YdiL (CAAX protease family)
LVPALLFNFVGLAVISTVHHAQFAGLLPLTALGATWTAIYLLSGNLVATIALHMMWNSRVFLGSMLSL